MIDKENERLRVFLRSLKTEVEKQVIGAGDWWLKNSHQNLIQTVQKEASSWQFRDHQATSSCIHWHWRESFDRNCGKSTAWS